jgi:FHA domain-containing protein
VIAAERAGTPFLIYRDGDSQLQALTLEPGSPVTVGRRTHNAVALGWDRQVSRVHAELRSVAGQWTIADDGLSTNGTFVNSRRIAGRRRLADGDRIRCGATVLVYRAPGDAASAVTSLASSFAPVDLTEIQLAVLRALCGPHPEHGRPAAPATNKEVADAVHLGVDAVKGHLRVLFRKFGIAELAQNQKRARLVQIAFERGLAESSGLGGQYTHKGGS